MRKLFHILIPLSFVFPVLVLISSVEFEASLVKPQFFSWLLVSVQSYLQAFLSAFVSVFIGFIISLGLLSVPDNSLGRWLRLICLTPALLPPIVLTSFLIFRFDSIGFQFQGLGAIVWTHALMNSGVCGVIFESFARRQLGSQLLAAKLLGSTDHQIVLRLVLPQIGSTAYSAFLLVFGLCLVSFLVPIMLAPSEYWSLEVLIYRVLKVDYDFQMAVLASLGQTLVMLVIVLLSYPKAALQSHSAVREALFRFSHLLSIPIFIFLLVFASMIFDFSLLKFAAQEVEPSFWKEWQVSFLFSLLITLVSVLVSLSLLLAVFYTFPKERLHRFLLAIVAISPVVLAFALLILGGNDSGWSLLKIGTGISWLYFPALYRWKIGAHLESLRGQAQVARSLGASDWMVFSRVVLPQSREPIVFVLMLMCLWASGDYVMTSVLSFSASSLPMLVETLSTSYRLGLAAFTSMSILLLGLCFAILIFGVDRILRSWKLLTRPHC